MNEPLISVIIPAHNSAKTIGTAINSITAQTYKNLEIIVVDDNSSDNTREIVEVLAKNDGRIKYYALPSDDPERIDTILKRNINAGYSARNFGFTKTSGELITFQDADDASLLNRIDVQYYLLTKYKATHICSEWARFDEQKLNTVLNVSEYLGQDKPHIGPDELYTLSQKNKGIVAKIFPSLNKKIPFHYKRIRIINKLFFGGVDPYPGAGNSPLFKREVIEKVKFRKLADRVWPSFMGRGADRDFNFQVAEMFKNSIMSRIPLYLWRTKQENPEYAGKNIDKDIS